MYYSNNLMVKQGLFVYEAKQSTLTLINIELLIQLLRCGPWSHPFELVHDREGKGNAMHC